MISLRSTYLSCALLALFAVPAFCSPVFYADSASWLAATTGVTTIGFEGLDPGPGSTVPETTGLVINNVTFFGYSCSTCGALWVVDPTAGSSYDFGTGPELNWAIYDNGSFVPYLQVTLPQAVTSVGLNIMTEGVSGVNYNVALNDLNFIYSTAATNAWPNSAFFGITSNTPFTSIAFQLPTSAPFVNPLIDNFSYGTQTPEPRSFLLIASGLIGIALLRRRVYATRKSRAS